ncbi:alpha/beta hydrolase [soil metagenome]
MGYSARMGASENSGSIAIAGRRLAWRSLGEGPPLILINGYAATVAEWDLGFLTELASGHQVLCPENRGMGRSELGDPAELAIDTMASDVLELLDRRSIESAPVIGWSMGGFIAQRIATTASERVESLVLLASDPGGPAAVEAEPGTWAALTDHSGTPREQASRLIELLFPQPLAREIDRDFGDVVAAARAALSVPALNGQEAAIRGWHADAPPGPAENAPPPVLVAHGTADVVIPPSNAARVAELWPGARVEMFEGGGHAFMAQEPVRLAKSIESFVSG